MSKLLGTILNLCEWINQTIIKIKKRPIQKVKGERNDS